MYRHNNNFTNRHDNFIITAPNYKIMQQSTLPAYLRIMEGEGEYKKGPAEFHINDGGIVYFRTSTEPDSVVGITNVRAIWGDEAGKYSLYFWENMQARASFRDCPIMLTTTPYTTNWIWKELIRPAKEGKRGDILLIEASSNENPHFPKEEFDRRRKTMDPRRFQALYMGQFTRMHGLVYDCLDESVHVIKEIELPLGTKFYAGVDWGHVDPFVLNVRAVTPSGRHFLVSEFVKTGMTVTDMVIVAKQKKAIFGIECFYADPSRADAIEEFNRNGLTCVGADNDIKKGVDLHYNLIKSQRYQIFNTCKHAIDEYSAYHYPEPDELKPDDDSKESKPVGQDDHSMDAERYVSVMTARSFDRRMPHVPIEKDLSKLSQEKRIAMLKKGGNRFKGSESW